jgi:RNA polymerase sigma factor (sigma-70 family)
LAAVPSIGRASAVEPRPAGPEAQATSLLYERYARQIFNFCLHRLGNREEAEDAAQTTFLNALRGIQRGVTPEIEQAWLFKIAENVCLTRHRSAFRRRRVESPSDLDVIQEIVPSPQRDAETLIRLPDALVEMPDQQRRALLLREWQGLSYREIAEELELSQPAVETLLFRARRSLANGLTEAPAPKRRARLRSGIDIGSILVAVKSAFAGGAAVKIAAVAAVATTTAVAGNKVESLQDARIHKAPATVTAKAAAPRSPVAQPTRHAVAAPVAATTHPVRVTTVRHATPASAKAATATAPARLPVTVAARSEPAETVPSAPEPETAAPARQELDVKPSEPKKLERGLSSDTAPPVHARHRGRDKSTEQASSTTVAPVVESAPKENGAGHGKGPKTDAPPEQPTVAPEQDALADQAEVDPAAADGNNGKHTGQRK